MASLWIGNIAPGTSDEELKAFLVKYGFPAFDAVEHVAGDGTRPAVVCTFNMTDPMALQALQTRVHNLYWKDRRLNVTVVSHARWEK